MWAVPRRNSGPLSLLGWAIYSAEVIPTYLLCNKSAIYSLSLFLWRVARGTPTNSHLLKSIYYLLLLQGSLPYLSECTGWCVRCWNRTPPVQGWLEEGGWGTHEITTPSRREWKWRQQYGKTTTWAGRLQHVIILQALNLDVVIWALPATQLFKYFSYNNELDV